MYMGTDNDLIFHLKCVQFLAVLTLYCFGVSYAGPTTMER